MVNPLSEISLLSLQLVDGLSVRMALSSANGGASRDLGLKILRVGGGGLTLGQGQAGRLGPTGPGPSRRGSVAPSLPWVLV
jgi:hypothetical protein